MLPLQGAWVPSLVGELRPHMPRGTAKNRWKSDSQTANLTTTPPFCLKLLVALRNSSWDLQGPVGLSVTDSSLLPCPAAPILLASATWDFCPWLLSARSHARANSSCAKLSSHPFLSPRALIPVCNYTFIIWSRSLSPTNSGTLWRQRPRSFL